MQKYYDDLDDYTVARPSRFMTFMKWFLPRFITAGCVVIVLLYCAHLEAM